MQAPCRGDGERARPIASRARPRFWVEIRPSALLGRNALQFYPPVPLTKRASRDYRRCVCDSTKSGTGGGDRFLDRFIS
jgi:hypothetical protein